jgi:hypothetical protein
VSLIELQYDSSGIESRPGSPQGGFSAEKFALKFNRSPPENTVVCHVCGNTIILFKNPEKNFNFPTSLSCQRD